MPVGDKDDGVRGRGGLDDHMVDVGMGLGEAKAVTERPAGLLVSVLRLQTLNKRIYRPCPLFGERCFTKNPAGGREAVEEFSSVESSNVARRQVSTTELFAAEGHGSSCKR